MIVWEKQFTSYIVFVDKETGNRNRRENASVLIAHDVRDE